MYLANECSVIQETDQRYFLFLNVVLVFALLTLLTENIVGYLYLCISFWKTSHIFGPPKDLSKVLSGNALKFKNLVVCV